MPHGGDRLGGFNASDSEAMFLAALPDPVRLLQLAHGHDTVGGWIGGDMGGTYGAGAWHDGHSGDHGASAGTHHSGHDPQGGALSAQHVFDHGAQGSSPAHAGDHGHFAAAHDLGALSAHAESHAPQVQNHAQHNGMGHG